MFQLKFLHVASAAFFAAVTIVSCSETGSGTILPDEKQSLPVPLSYTVSSYWTTAEISWEPVAECEYYRCELFSGDAPEGDPVYETTVDEPLVLLEDLLPGATYTMELYACPSVSSVDYKESEAVSILFTTESESVDFRIELSEIEEDPEGGLFATVSWIPRDKTMLYFPFMAQGELYDEAASDDAYIESYYETLQMMAQVYGMTFEQYLSNFLKRGDFSGGSIIPQAGKYYAIAFGCESDGTPTTKLYKLAIQAE